MTSQGVGEPFGPGEVIMGYQACQMHGRCYIDVDKVYGEKLTHLEKGASAVFRYVRNENDWTGIRITAAGSGRIVVQFNGEIAGVVEIHRSGGFVPVEATIKAKAGVYELTLFVEDADSLEIAEVVLEPIRK